MENQNFSEGVKLEPLLKKIQRGERLLYKRIQKASRYLAQYQLEMEQGVDWRAEAHIGDLLKSHFHLLKKGLDSITVEDWDLEGEKKEIALDPMLEPQDLVKSYFKRSKKLKKRKEVLPQLIEKIKREIEQLDNYVHEIKTVETESHLQLLCKKAHIPSGVLPQKKSPHKTLPYREFTTEKGGSILVGRNAAGNEQLSFSIAHGNDMWLHVAGVPGSHIVVRSTKDQPIDEELVKDALQLCLHFSQLKNKEEGEVTVTYCKFIKRTGRKLGQVAVSQHKTVKVKCDPQRLRKVMESASTKDHL